MRLVEIKQQQSLPYNVEQIKAQLSLWNVKRFKIHPDGTVDVTGSLMIRSENFTKLPITFGKITGDFTVVNCNKLISLENFPHSVKNFFVSFCDNITSLEGFPTEVRGITELAQLGGITSFKGLSETLFSDKLRFSSCKNIGPDFQGLPTGLVHFEMSNCSSIKSLKGLPEKMVKLQLFFLPELLSLEFIPKECKHLTIVTVPKVRNVLKLLTVKNLDHLSITLDDPNSKLTRDQKDKMLELLQKYTPLGDIIECQEEFIEAGLKEYARLK